MNDRRVPTVVFGDTSSFHMGSALNYGEFRKLLTSSSEILSEIPHDFFSPDPVPPTAFVRYRAFRARLRASRFWAPLTRCERIVVHAEGLTNLGTAPMHLCTNFATLAAELDVEAWMVNFGAFRADAFVDRLRGFSYLAVRDPITQAHIGDLGIEAVLSFDCCVLSRDQVPPLHRDPVEIVAIRGKDQMSLARALESVRHTKLDMAWGWTRVGGHRGRWADLLGVRDPEAVRLGTVEQYLERMRRARFVVSTSFHANIFSLLAGIPFVSLAPHAANRKYQGTMDDLLPPRYRVLSLDDVLAPGFAEDTWRAEVNAHYRTIFAGLQERARRNVPPSARP